jgi:streptomycin 6-kinase
MQPVPFEPGPVSAYPSVAAWAASAPGIVARMLRRWDLRAGEAFVGGVGGSVLSVNRADGSPAVLKVGYPHEEAIWEAVGLSAFGSLSPEILDQDAWTWALLLALIEPGTPLSKAWLSTRDALIAGGRLHARLTNIPLVGPAASIPTLRWAMFSYARSAEARLEKQAGDLDRLGVRSLVVAAIGQLESLAADHGSPTLLHGDFNPGNILDSGEGGWKLVDPKPLLGDPAYDLWPLVSQVGHPYHAPNAVARLAENLTIAADAAEVDRDRAARWSFARTGLNVSWYLEDGLPTRAVAEAAALKSWALVSGA